MNTERLQYFLAVAHEENITAAASTLFISQAHLSREIIALEKELGKKLFVRTKRGTHLTPEGVVFRSYASEILRLLDQSKMEIAMAEQALSGEIRIGCPESVAMRFFASDCTTFRQENPHIWFKLKTGSPDYLLSLLEEGELDFVVHIGPLDTDIFDRYTLPQHDCWGLLAPKGHSLLDKETVHARDLLGIPLLVPEQLLEHNRLSSWAGDLMDSFDITATYELIFAPSLMVEEGLGCALSLSPLLDTPRNEPLYFRRLDPPLTDNLELVWKSHRPMEKQADYFIQHIKRTIENKTYVSTRFFIKDGTEDPPPPRGPPAQGAPGNPLLRDEAIPHPAHRLDEGSMLAEFLAQREDVHVDRSAATCEVPSPHVLQQRIAGKGDAGVFHEMKEQVELARCER